MVFHENLQFTNRLIGIAFFDITIDDLKFNFGLFFEREGFMKLLERLLKPLVLKVEIPQLNMLFGQLFFDIGVCLFFFRFVEGSLRSREMNTIR